MSAVSQKTAIILAAIAAAEFRHFDASGFGRNRAWARRLGKSKGGGRGRGVIDGLPKSSHYIANIPREGK